MGGRHAHPEASHFWRSLGVAVLRGGLVLVAVVGLFAVVSFIARDAGDDSPAMVRSPETPAPLEAGEADPAEADARDVEDEETGDRAGEDTEERAEDAAAIDPAGVTVQVLDGVGDPDLAEEVADLLRDAGYDVVAVNPAARDYELTTALYSEGREAEARSVTELDDRFAEVDRNPNLSEAVDVHIVVGHNWDS